MLLLRRNLKKHLSQHKIPFGSVKKWQLSWNKTVKPQKQKISIISSVGGKGSKINNFEGESQKKDLVGEDD